MRELVGDEGSHVVGEEAICFVGEIGGAVDEVSIG